VAGWHPAVSWIDRQLRIEREAACDETAVLVTGSAKAYAACLAKLASLPQIRLGPLPALGVLTSSDLPGRVGRILALGTGQPLRSPRGAIAAAVLLLCPLTLTVGGLRIVEPAASVTAVEHAQVVARVSPYDDDTDNMGPLIPGRPSDEQTDARVPVRLARSTPQRRSRPDRPITRAPTRLPAPASRDSSPSDREGNQAAPIVRSGSVQAPEPSPPFLNSIPHEFVPIRVSGAGANLPSRRVGIADASVEVGRRSQRAAVATGNFFSRFGKTLAGSF
jgi:hypothetical protein